MLEAIVTRRFVENCGVADLNLNRTMVIKGNLIFSLYTKEIGRVFEALKKYQEAQGDLLDLPIDFKFRLGVYFLTSFMQILAKEYRQYPEIGFRKLV
jgi:hypothetical protein